MQIFRDFLVTGSTFDFVLLAFLLGTFLDASIEELLNIENILHRRKRDKGDRRKVFQFHIVDGVADIQKFHLERVTDVASSVCPEFL